MSNPTSNFNWQMPTPTDLVTDLPADFEVFGQAVDSTLADLKGGTSGQILSKNSNTDMDFVWTTPNPGDITGVTAGTGISGGGTSGDVTITNSMATAIDAKGDLIVGIGADAFSRLAVGNNGETPVADSSTSTGLKWGYATAPAVYSSNSTTQTISNATWTAVGFDTEDFDTSGFHSTVTNTSRYTIPAGLAGKYLLNTNVKWANNATGTRIVRFRKNNTLTLAIQEKSSAAEFADQVSTICDLAVGDYVEVFVYQGSGGNLGLYGNSYDGRCTNFSMTYLGA